MGGCVSGTNDINNLRKSYQNPIIDLIRKIKLVCEQHQAKKLKTLAQQELILIQNFGLDKKQRALYTEKTIINRTAFTKNLALIYKILEAQCKRVIDYKETMERNLDSVTASIQVLIYAATIVKEQLLFELERRVRANYPQFRYPLDQDIRHEIVRHHKKTEQVPFKMQNEYILQFCINYSIDVNRICEVGHKYRFGAIQQE